MICYTANLQCKRMHYIRWMLHLNFFINLTGSSCVQIQCYTQSHTLTITCLHAMQLSQSKHILASSPGSRIGRGPPREPGDEARHIRADASVGIAYALLHAGPAVQ